MIWEKKSHVRQFLTQPISKIGKWTKNQKQKVKEKWQTFIQFLQNELKFTPSLPHFTHHDLAILFDAVDQFYFGHSLQKWIQKAPISLTFQLINHNKQIDIAGLCTRTSLPQPKYDRSLKKYIEHEFVILLNLHMFNKLFASPSHTSFVSNGQSCYSKLECLMNVLVHEICHFILMFVVPDISEKEQAHGKSFKRLAKYLFGHTDYKHALTISRKNEKSNIKLLLRKPWRQDKKHIFYVELPLTHGKNKNNKTQKIAGHILKFHLERALFQDLSPEQNKYLIPYFMFVL